MDAIENEGSTERGRTSYNEVREYFRILKMLDQQQQMNISAHLYSSFLISKTSHLARKGSTGSIPGIPRKWWIAWPQRDAPAPSMIDDSIPSDEPCTVSEEQITRLQREYLQRNSGMEPDSEPSARKVFLNVCEEVLQRYIHKRIHQETRADVEPILEPEPTINEGSKDILLETVGKYALRTNGKAVWRRGLIDWKQLGLEGPARERLLRLFEGDYMKYTEVYEDISDDDDEDEDEDDDADADTDTTGVSDNIDPNKDVDLSNEADSNEGETPAKVIPVINELNYDK